MARNSKTRCVVSIYIPVCHSERSEEPLIRRMEYAVSDRVTPAAYVRSLALLGMTMFLFVIVWRRIMTSHFRFGFLALTWLVTANPSDTDPTPADPRRSSRHVGTTEEREHTNRLAREKSPYLLQHAHNPVDR